MMHIQWIEASSPRIAGRNSQAAIKGIVVFTALVAVLAMSASAVFAGGITYTSFNDGFNSPNEPTHSELLDNIYGATFGASGVDFTNGTVTARRVFDQGGIMGTLNLVTLIRDRPRIGESMNQCEEFEKRGGIIALSATPLLLCHSPALFHNILLYK